MGVRISIPWIFNGPGYNTPAEADADGTGARELPVGGIRTVLDVFCNGVPDYMAPARRRT